MSSNDVKLLEEKWRYFRFRKENAIGYDAYYYFWRKEQETLTKIKELKERR